VWAYPGTAQKRLATPINLGTGFSYGLQIWQVYIHRMHPNKSALKILEKSERGPGHFFGYRYPIISGTGKAIDFKFGTHIPRVNQTKSP